VWSTEPSKASPSSFISKHTSKFSPENTITDIVPCALIGIEEHHQGKKAGWDNRVQGWERRPIDILIFSSWLMLLTYPVMVRWPGGKGTSNLLTYSRETRLVKPSISQEYMARQGNDTGTGCDLGEEEILTLNKIKVQGKPYDRN
jgi:hypothetical protein